MNGIAGHAAESAAAGSLIRSSDCDRVDLDAPLLLGAVQAIATVLMDAW